MTRHDNNKEETYVGLTENTFKTRYDGHTCSFRDKSKRYSTALSNYIRTLKDSNTDYTIRWKIVDRGRAYSPSTKICNLCLKEKYIIICKPQMASLNSRNELKTECRHRKNIYCTNYNQLNGFAIVTCDCLNGYHITCNSETSTL